MHQRTQLVYLYTHVISAAGAVGPEYLNFDNPWKFSRKQNPDWLTFPEREVEKLTNTQCNILGFVKLIAKIRTIHQHASHPIFHPNNFPQATLLSLILADNLPLIDCSSPNLKRRKGAQEIKAGVDGQECWGLSGPHRLHSRDTMALCQASRALLILQREVRERLCTGHVSLLSLVSLYIMYKRIHQSMLCALS